MTSLNCEVCGKEYDDAAENIRPHARRIYDPFDCAVERAVPRCPRCGSLVVVADHSRTTDEHPGFSKAGMAPANR
ncbi:MAG TPA: hypothetical protein VEY33_07215 [Gemmatimonadota bacterium]|nr:hypothetical protein [Gemmatimonadota bacterium]